MGTRKRFTKAERALFTPGTRVEWLNASTWRPGVVTGGIATDSIGHQYLTVTDRGKTTRTITSGQLVRAYCKSIRLKPCTCGTPNRAVWHLQLILGRGDSQTGTETSDVDLYLCDQHLPAEENYLSLMDLDPTGGWSLLEATLTEIPGRRGAAEKAVGS